MWRRRGPGAAAGALCALLLACSPGGDGQPVDPGGGIPELPAGVHALAGISESLPYADLEPLRGMVGQASFVALGESTHMSGGFYQAKGRLIRFMVEQMGFRVVTLETPWLEAQAATAYVASCTGTPEAAVASLNPVWRDVAVRDLLRWLCDYNRAHPGDPVTFLGFDIQEPWKTAPALQAFVQAAAPGEAARAEPLMRCLGATHGSSQFFNSQEYRDHAAGIRNTAAHEACVGGIAQMESWITANAAALAGASSAAAVEEARIALVSLRAWQETLWVPDPASYQARDAAMAQVLRRLHALHTPGRKAVVWAWNWHIARRYEEVRGWNDDPQAVVPRQSARSMGSFLNEALGAGYLPIALIGYRVEINSANPSPPVPTNPLAAERRLHDLGRQYLLVDLRQPLPETLLPAGRAYPVSQEWADPYRQFGALLFLDYSPPMTFVR